MLERLKQWLMGASPPMPAAAKTTVGSAGTVAATADGQPARAGGPGLVVIDVRSEREFQATAIEQAVNLPLPQLAQRIRGVVADPATPLVLYCASGARSGMACMVLRQMGYANVTNAGGLYAAAVHLQREVRR
ncbi:MAG: rhodanese-like domain-containing protein [Burkholderiales bacterium]|jgi:phage shock protein E|nr:rhodanese-like domain-containing protein [Burkholderiales bacterium]